MNKQNDRKSKLLWLLPAAVLAVLAAVLLIREPEAPPAAEPTPTVTIRDIPFSGSSGVGKNEQMPLAAVVYLSQASQTTIAPLRGFRAFRRLWEGCSVNLWDREDLDACEQTRRTLEQTLRVHAERSKE